MTPAEAEALSTRMMVTWSKMVIPPSEWEDVFKDLDAGTAGTAFIRLRTSEKYPPTIAEFMSTYRSLPTVHNQPIHDGPKCGECGGDGFNTITEVHNGIAYPATFKACRCREGEQAQIVLNDINSRNDRELGRTGRHEEAAA